MTRARQSKLPPGARRCRAKFLRHFPGGFRDELYIDWERDYKWQAHKRWAAALDRDAFKKLLAAGKFDEIAARAVSIESRTNLLFSFEKMALRDAVKAKGGARAFSQGLFDFLHGPDKLETRFSRWCAVVGALPRRQTRVLTWPVVTIMGFLAQPKTHFFSQTYGDAGGRAALSVSVRLPIQAQLGDLQEPARTGAHRACRSQRPQAARHDRHPIVFMGSGIGGISLNKSVE